jgi:tryptophanyl-tRNA synthetase
MKKNMITGVQPTGRLTLANYIGAIKNFVNMQDDYNSYIFVADLHGLTTYQEPKEFNERVLELSALFLACGIDPNKTTFFIQSEVDEHSVLGYLIAFQSRVGELARMTQYKAKKESNFNGGVDLGLFIYPTLMAADILLYDAHIVPVGADQKQHIEITRDLAERFNKKYGEMFVLPDHSIPKVGSRIMNLQNPLEKMSKSANIDDKGTLFLLDDLEVIRKKIMSAKTDSESIVKYDIDNKPGISNLMTILSVLSGMSFKEIEEKHKESNYGTFKKEVADIVVKQVEEIQKRYNEVRCGGELIDILKEGANKARKVAKAKLDKVKSIHGITY